MRYSCKNCMKEQSCFKQMRFRFGFCETDFQQKPKAPAEPSAGMKWKQLSGTEWEAKGKYGVFKIELSRKHRKQEYWASYASEDTSFNMPPQGKLSEAKDMCERNANWEDAV